MFTGNAQSAMDLYVSLFPDSRIVSGREFMCSDSPVKHAFSFTPSNSIFVECDSMDMLTRSFDVLSQDGGVLMPPGNYGFSRYFCWVNDRFGVSWQLNLAAQ
jgi:predicted 3-demethylubiquinone-9 3-methyltransferase (glyoxalase superfamily)